LIVFINIQIDKAPLHKKRLCIFTIFSDRQTTLRVFRLLPVCKVLCGVCILLKFVRQCGSFGESKQGECAAMSLSSHDYDPGLGVGHRNSRLLDTEHYVLLIGNVRVLLHLQLVFGQYQLGLDSFEISEIFLLSILRRLKTTSFRIVDVEGCKSLQTESFFAYEIVPKLL
jgi:hypothetical protein